MHKYQMSKQEKKSKTEKPLVTWVEWKKKNSERVGFWFVEALTFADVVMVAYAILSNTFQCSHNIV